MHGNFWKSWAGKSLMWFGGWKASDWKANDYQWYTKDKRPHENYEPANLDAHDALNQLALSLSYMRDNGVGIRIELLLNFNNSTSFGCLAREVPKAHVNQKYRVWKVLCTLVVF